MRQLQQVRACVRVCVCVCVCVLLRGPCVTFDVGSLCEPRCDSEGGNDFTRFGWHGVWDARCAGATVNRLFDELL